MRFSDNPLKTPLAGNELIPATDPGTGDDIAFTPQVMTEYAQSNLQLATATGNGFVTGDERTKLDDLYDRTDLDSIISQLGQIEIPIFMGAPTAGFYVFLRHVLTTPMEWNFLWFRTSTGSLVFTIRVNSAPIAGLQNLTATSAQDGASATPGQLLNQGDEVGIEIMSTSTPANLYVTIRGDRSITP